MTGSNANSILSERMIQLRGKRSQGEAARILGITQAYLSEIERGKKIPSYLVLITIAAAYKTSVAYLLGEVETSEALTPSYRVPSGAGASDVQPAREPVVYLRTPSADAAMPVYTTDRLLAQLRCEGLSRPFAVIADSGALAAFGIPFGAEVAIDPAA
jgi:transcriptional regulator with XRE-family HTH domain